MQDSSGRPQLARVRENSHDYREEIEAGAEDIELEAKGNAKMASAQVRKGILMGGMLGLVVGIVPMLLSMVMGAVGGGLIARASQMRVDGVSAPRIHFARRGPSGHRE